ncbi:hypothetical protein C5L38_33765 (plasmid) [Streptomyces sp. WAC00288]|uniref:hypothetical protein n=1 Tax=unclassified Streptomyces TaxID=2593676 RepID=UPI0007889310|nr:MULTISPECIES: hypothetical protein [unclassified Streptomyces]AVI00050.1 hypothetical protein C5L38_33765 [Streptomyces sp. WAC00288]KYG51114.1 hypothetical protein AWI43_32190 [Streptomyces sp. WAC04657]
MDKEFIKDLAPTVVAVAAILGAFAGARVQARAAVTSVRRGHQRSSYAELIRVTRAYLNDTRRAAEAAGILDEHCQPHLGPEDDEVLTTESRRRLEARITPAATDTAKLSEAVALVLLEGPKTLSAQAERVSTEAEKLCWILENAGRPTETVDGSTDWPHPDRADSARGALDAELGKFVEMATKFLNKD